MSTRSNVDRKNFHIPKYAGFIPGTNANSELGKTYTNITRVSYAKDNKANHTAFKSNGFYPDCEKFDETRPTHSRRYGTETRFPPHPCLNETWDTTTRVSFPKPLTQDKPTCRIKIPGSEILFDGTLRDGYRKTTKASGYQENSLLQDGKTYATALCLHTDQRRTEYRNRFNQPKPFHKMTAKDFTGRKTYKGSVYDFKDGNNPSLNWTKAFNNNNSKWAPRKAQFPN